MLRPKKPPPIPGILDPAKAQDRLPQPFRMIDKILAEIVELSLDICLAKDKQKRVVKATHIDTIFSPHAMLVADGKASCFSTVGVAGMAVVGTTEGNLFAHTARDPLQIGKHQAHTSTITAMDVGHIAATGAKVIASASAEQLIIHDVVIKTSELRQLAQVDLPVSPSGVAEAPANVSLSTNAGHVAIWWPSGAIAVYEVNLPAFFYKTTSVEAGIDAPPPDLSGGELKMVLHFSEDVVRALLVDNGFMGSCNIEWQQQQRPDKSGKSDRNHRPARGIYIWWVGCNKLTLSFLDDTCPPNKPQATPVQAPEAAPPAPPTPTGRSRTPGKGGSASKAAAAAAAAAAEKQKQAAAAAKEEELSKQNTVKRAPSKGWLLPMGITSSCVSENGKMLAFGMDDGTVLVWDDHFGGHTKILPRLPAAVSAVAFVNGAFNLIFATSLEGSVYLADITRPEDSHMSRAKLPHTCVEINFLPNDPFAICVCPGNEENHPRLVWFDMQHEKLIAELSGKTENGFGRAGLAGFPGTGSNVPTDEPVPRQTMPCEALPPPPTTSMPAPSSPSSAGKPLSSEGPLDPPSSMPGTNPTQPTTTTTTTTSKPPGTAHSPANLPPITTPNTTPSTSTSNPSATTHTAGTAGSPHTEQGGGNTDTHAPHSRSPSHNVPEELRVLQYRHLLWPRTSFRDSYVVVGGPTPESTRAHLGFRPGEKEVPRDAHLYLYKIDAIARMMLPEEMASSASKNLLDRMLADLDPPHKRRSRVKMGVEDPDAPKPPPSAMRKSGELPSLAEPKNDDEAPGERRHIRFNEADLQGLLNEEHGSGKQFKKETRSGGYSEGRKPANLKLDLSKFGVMPKNTANLPKYMQERPSSPPWHHTNPLARIHPDWEEAPVLSRMMDRLGQKGGGRRRRDRRLGSMASEIKQKMAKEGGNLIFK